MESLVELITNEIRNRPAMYVGRNSIFCLQSFFNGLSWKESAFYDIEILSEFQNFIEKKYRIETTHSWASIIHFFSADECDALKKFFIDFDEFLVVRKNNNKV